MTRLPVVRTVRALRERVQAWRVAGETVALVPTMGALHAGHLSLVDLARRHAARIVASLFVNPAQFGPAEDFSRYPRDEARDGALLAAAGCDLLYAPDVAAIYPPGFVTRVALDGPALGLEGAARPGHFDGVATVVAKLLIQCAPDAAVFGEKDYQQLLVIRRLAADLDLPVAIVAGPIVRDADGLALSSRNAYLDPAGRAVAPALNRVLIGAARTIAAGGGIAEAEAAAVQALLSAGFDAVDYLETRDAADLTRLGPGRLDGRPARLLAVGRLGATRLLDNVAVRAASCSR